MGIKKKHKGRYPPTAGCIHPNGDMIKDDRGSLHLLHTDAREKTVSYSSGVSHDTRRERRILRAIQRP